MLKKLNIDLQNSLLKLTRREQVLNQAISKEDLDDAYYQKLNYEAQVEKAKADLDYAATQVDDTNLFSPNAGFILTRIREPGSVLKVSEPILTLTLNEPIWVRAYISELNLGKIFIYKNVKQLVFHFISNVFLNFSLANYLFLTNKNIKPNK